MLFTKYINTSLASRRSYYNIVFVNVYICVVNYIKQFVVSHSGYLNWRRVCKKIRFSIVIRFIRRFCDHRDGSLRFRIRRGVQRQDRKMGAVGRKVQLLPARQRR